MTAAITDPQTIAARMVTNAPHLSESQRKAFERLGIKSGRGVPTATIAPPDPSATPAQPAESQFRDVRLPPGYIPPPWLNVPKFVLASHLHTLSGCILRGEASVGKSTAVAYLVKWLREQSRTVELFTVQCFDGMAIEDLRGVWIIEGGETKFLYGPVALAIIYSYANPDAIVVLNFEEANMVRPGVLSWLNTVTAGNDADIFLPSGERVSPTPGRLKVMLCYNDGYVGTRDMNQALSDRLQPVDCIYPSTAAESEILHSHTGLDLPHCRSIAELARVIRSKKETHHYNFSMRTTIALASAIKAGWEPLAAFVSLVLPRVGAPDSETGEFREAVNQLAMSAGIDKWKSSLPTPEPPAAFSYSSIIADPPS